MTNTNTGKRAKNMRRLAKRTPTAKRPGRRPPARYRSRRTLMAGLVVVVLGVVAAVALNRPDTGPSSPGRPFVGGDLHSLVMGPGTPSRLYVGGHEGVAVSVDGGRTWRQIESLDDADAMGWAFTDEGALVGGHPGLFVSDDGGRTSDRITRDSRPRISTRSDPERE